MNAHSNKGVTLIELCIVIAVIAVFFGIAWPVLRGLAAGTEIENDCRKLTSTLIYARDLAIAENRRYKLEFDLEKRRYILSAETKEPGVFELVGVSDNAKRCWPKNAEVPAISGTELVFEPDGSTDNFRMVIKDNKGHLFEIIYDNLKGKCEVNKS